MRVNKSSRIRWWAAIILCCAVVVALAILLTIRRRTIRVADAKRLAQEKVKEASRLVLDREWEEASELLEEAVSLRPGFAEAHVCRGRVLALLGREEEAVESYEAGLKAFDERLKDDPNDPHVLSNKAFVLAILGRRAEAISLLDRASRSFPDNSDVRRIRSELDGLVASWTTQPE